MDAMVLLCNLHADGPATLRVLRRARLCTLSDVAAARVHALADTLGVSPSTARRFAREARLLAERVGPPVLDVEECSIDADAARSDATRTVGLPRALRDLVEGVRRAPRSLDAEPPLHRFHRAADTSALEGAGPFA